MSRRSFLTGAAATFGAITLDTKSLQAQESSEGVDVLVNQIQALTVRAESLKEHFERLSQTYGEHFRENDVESLDDNAKAQFQEFLTETEAVWTEVSQANAHVEVMLEGTTREQYIEHGLEEHPNVALIDVRDELLQAVNIFPLRMNIAREALGLPNNNY